MAGNRRTQTVRCQPAGTDAAVNALAPGMGSREARVPDRRTSAAPGSEIPGVPASLTRATDSPGPKPVRMRVDPALFVVLVEAEERCLDLVVPEQVTGAPRVFGGDQIDFAEHPQRPQRDVLEVADRRRDDEERARRRRNRADVALHARPFIVRLEVGSAAGCAHVAFALPRLLGLAIDNARGRAFPALRRRLPELSLRGASDSATMDGVHLHDDLLEDFRRPAIDTHLSALAGFARRLDAIPVDSAARHRTGRARALSRRTSARGCSRSRQVRSWERNPHVYAETLASSLAAQAIFDYAPEPERARRVLSKLRQTPRLIEAARENIKEPPAMFVKVGVETLRGVMTFIDSDLPQGVFDGSTICTCLPISPMRRPRPSQSIGAYVEYLETDVRPRAKASFRLGKEKFEQKLRLDEGIALPGRAAARDCRTRAARDAGGVPHAGRPTQRRRPDRVVAKGEAGIASGAGAAARRRRARSIGELQTFLERNSVVSMPEEATVDVAPTPDFFRWSFASMWTPGPFEPRASRAVYYLTDADPSWPHERQCEHLRDFNIPTLWNISIHEVFPGHYLHYQHLRKRRIEGAPLDALHADVLCRRLGALLRTDDDRGRLRPPRSHTQARAARRGAGASRALRRRHSSSHRGLVGGAGRALFSRRSVSRRGERAARGRARARSIRRISSTPRASSRCSSCGATGRSSRVASRRCARSTMR